MKNNKLLISGILTRSFDEKRISDNFITREIIITLDHNTQYPQTISLTLVNQKCDLIIGKRPGDSVTCEIQLKGREWNGKFYNTIYCIDLVSPAIE